MSTPAPNKIWMVRHGETEWSLSGQHTGRTDIGLTANGEQQAREAGEVLKSVPFAAVYSSPLARAKSTCQLAGFGDRMQINDNLAEWHYGELEGKTRTEFTSTHPGWDLWKDGPPGGESIAQVLARAYAFLDSIKTQEGNILVFSHGHFLRYLATAWVTLDATLIPRLALDTGSISVLGYERVRPVIRHWNHVPGARF